jgi:hypothetical protein
MKKKLLYILLSTMILASCSGKPGNEEEFSIEGQTSEGFEDGTYCAEVTYSNPNTGTENTYTLEVEVESNEVIQINWNNGGWLDEDHFSAEQLDENGQCSFTSDKGYDYTIELTGMNCGNVDSENPYALLNLPKYSYEEATQLIGMSEAEKAESKIYSEGDVLSENDLVILKKEMHSAREYIRAMRGYEQGYEQEIANVKRSQKNLQNDIANGYVQHIERRSAYGASIQIVIISKGGINYMFEVMGDAEVTMGTAKFNENTTGWQTVYIKQYPNIERYSGYRMRIIDSGF